jgi:hypothetical protein
MAIVVVNFETCERCFGLIFLFRMVVLTSFFSLSLFLRLILESGFGVDRGERLYTCFAKVSYFNMKCLMRLTLPEYVKNTQIMHDPN